MFFIPGKMNVMRESIMNRLMKLLERFWNWLDGLEWRGADEYLRSRRNGLEFVARWLAFNSRTHVSVRYDACRQCALIELDGREMAKIQVSKSVSPKYCVHMSLSVLLPAQSAARRMLIEIFQDDREHQLCINQIYNCARVAS